MDKESVDKIINSFYGKQFTKRVHLLFGQWLRSKGERLEKEEFLECLWVEAPSVYTQRTQEKWEEIRKQLNPFVRKRRTITYSLMKYAAVILLMVLSGAGTYYFAVERLYENEVIWKELFVPHGEEQSVLLSDGTEVSVAAGSLLVYPEEFKGNDRPVFLSGEATFAVTPDKNKPFFVKTRLLEVEVLGTNFTVNSYPGDIRALVTLEKGCVKVDTHDASAEKVVLRPGEQLIYQHKDQSTSIHSIDIELHKMERKGYLIFKELPFNQILVILERKYNVTIYCDVQQYADHKCNLKFGPDETIADVLEVLQRLLHIEYNIEGKVIYIN